LVPIGFHVTNIIYAIIGALVISVVSFVLSRFIPA
jgi:uncharacterized membrane protein YvlD (DUF360 family)